MQKRFANELNAFKRQYDALKWEKRIKPIKLGHEGVSLASSRLKPCSSQISTLTGLLHQDRIWEGTELFKINIEKISLPSDAGMAVKSLSSCAAIWEQWRRKLVPFCNWQADIKGKFSWRSSGFWNTWGDSTNRMCRNFYLIDMEAAGKLDSITGSSKHGGGITGDPDSWDHGIPLIDLWGTEEQN
jgi:hypothetical protein